MLAPIGVLLVLNVHSDRERLVERARSDVLTQATLVASAHDQLLETVEQLLNALAIEPVIADYDSEACNDLVRRLTAAHPAYSNIAISDLEGTVRCSANPAGIGSRVADRPYHQEAIESGEIATSGYLFGRISQKPVDVFARRILDATGEPAAVVEVSVDIAWIQTLIASRSDSDRIRTTVVGADGLLLVQVPADDSVAGDAWTAEVESVHGVTQHDIHLDGQPTALGAIVPLRALGGATPAYVIVTTPREQALSAAHGTFRRGLATVGIVGVLGMVWAWGISTLGVHRPVRALLHAVRSYGSGSFDARVQVSPMSSGEITELAGAFESMADDLAESHDELRRRATTDQLTGLPNRVEFARLADEHLVDDPGSGQAQIILQLRGFGSVNATLGFEGGDGLLRQVAPRLTATLGEAALIGRGGGDEFLVLAPMDPDRLEDCERLLDKAFDEPFQLEGQPIFLSYRAGASCYPRDGRGAPELVQRASLALRRTKLGRLNFAVYEASRDEPRASQLQTLAALRAAVANGELELHYQPKVDLQWGKLCGAEALMRWRRNGEYVPPSEFITLAEQTGYIRTLTAWALETAGQQVQAWHEDGLDIRVGLNISATDFDDRELAQRLVHLRSRWQLIEGGLDIEITEGSLMSDPDDAVRICHALRDAGYTIAIDDFGTGYSPLVYLKRLPVTSIKIDQTFVRDILEDRRSRDIVENTIELAHRFGLTAVAEGIETAEVADLLRSIGCDVGQGYLFGRAMPAGELGALARGSD